MSNLEEAPIIVVLKLYDGNWDTRVTGGGANIQEVGFQHPTPCKPPKLHLCGWFLCIRLLYNVRCGEIWLQRRVSINDSFIKFYFLSVYETWVPERLDALPKPQTGTWVFWQLASESLFWPVFVCIPFPGHLCCLITHPSQGFVVCHPCAIAKQFLLMWENIFWGQGQISTFISSHDSSRLASVPSEVKCMTYFISCQEAEGLSGSM